MSLLFLLQVSLSDFASSLKSDFALVWYCFDSFSELSTPPTLVRLLFVGLLLLRQVNICYYGF